MTLLMTMLPIYVLGNLHCLGMCGPLVMMLGKSPYRHWYFLGRTLSFTLAGTFAGGFGAILGVVFQEMHLGALTSFLFGSVIFISGVYSYFHWPYPGYTKLAKLLAPFNQKLSMALLSDKPWPAFLFGFFTILLPCGQTLIVYTACALSGDLLVGTVNGFVFAVLTTPSLILAMQAQGILKFARNYANQMIGIAAMLVGVLAVLRGLAEMGMIPHMVLNTKYHLIIY